MANIREQSKAIHRRLDELSPSSSIPSTTTAKQITAEAQSILDNGYVILRDLISPTDLATVRSAVAQISPHNHMGRNNFEGRRTTRVYGLPAKTRATDRLILHPRVVQILDDLLLPNPLLSAMQAINIHPGESVQPFHTDASFVQPESPHPKPLFSIATVWAMTDFTKENGATLIVPGSHRLSAEEVDFSKAVPVEMSAGSVVVFASNLWHGGGANSTESDVREAITFQYCEPYLRPQENVLLGLDPAEARELDPKLQSMLGFSIHPPFIGHFDGVHPLRSPWMQRGKL